MYWNANILNIEQQSTSLVLSVEEKDGSWEYRYFITCEANQDIPEEAVYRGSVTQRVLEVSYTRFLFEIPEESTFLKRNKDKVVKTN